MNCRKSYKCNYHKKRHDFRLISEIRRWIIDFWYNFIKRLKNVLSERRLSRIQSLHTKSITNISAHLDAEQINHVLAAPRVKSPKSKRPRKHRRKVEKKSREEIFEELSDDYLALYRKKSSSHLIPRQTESVMIDRKRSSCSTRSRRASRHSQINIMVQEVTQKYVGDGFIDDLNWVPRLFGCVLPSRSTSRMSLHKIEDSQGNNDGIDTKNQLEKVKITHQKCSKIPRYQFQHPTVMKPKPKIPYSKHHRNCISNN